MVKSKFLLQMSGHIGQLKMKYCYNFAISVCSECTFLETSKTGTNQGTENCIHILAFIIYKLIQNLTLMRPFS